MLIHGWPKILNFKEYSADFYDFLGLGFTISLALTVFAEFFCALLIVFGLGTRLACIPLLITMGVIIFDVHAGSPIEEIEIPLFYTGCYVALLCTGAGKYSLDYYVWSKSTK
jgi:putative oxidoreductase